MISALSHAHPSLADYLHHYLHHMSRPVWLDVDPVCYFGLSRILFQLFIKGHDDAIAILLATMSNQLEILGISTVRIVYMSSTG